MSNWLVAIATIVLALVTARYVSLTKQLLVVQSQEGLLSEAPVLGIKVKSIELSPEFSADLHRRDLSIALDVENIGAGPALEIEIDGFLRLDYVLRDGKSWIPARFEQSLVPFLKPSERAESHSAELAFGNHAIDALLENIKMQSDMNYERIRIDPTHEAYSGTWFCAVVSYRNIRGQWYSATLEVPIGLSHEWVVCSEENPEPRFPLPEDRAEFGVYSFPRSRYSVKPASRKQVEASTASRDGRRQLSGW